MDLLIWAAWGFLGAFVYAAPRLAVVLGDRDGKPMGGHIAEFCISLSFGPIFAAGFGPFAAGWANVKAGAELQAGALVIGMVANPVAPIILKLATGEIARRIGGASNGADK
jgi:hypothetical protein